MPLKHKATNAIRFIPFSERINNVSVDIIHRIGHKNEEEDISDTESYFYVAVQKWNDLNCSQGWKEFSSEVRGVRTLAQVLLMKEQTVSTLLSYLQKKDPLTVQALLETVIALARDLRKEMYPYYPEILQNIISILNSKDAEVLEWAFQCLAYLFKFLWRCMVHTIDQVLFSLLPLLSPKYPKYINYFAADSFAYLARKVKDQTSFVCLIVNHLKNQPEDTAGCGRLIFAWMRGIKGQLHSSAQNLLLLVFRLLSSELIPSALLESLLSHTLTHLAVEIRPGGLSFVWEAIETSLAVFSSDKCADWQSVSRVLRLASQLCQHNQAIHLTSPTQFINKLLLLFSKCRPLPEIVMSPIIDIVAVLLLSPYASVSQQYAAKLTTEVMATPYHSLTFSFVNKLLMWGSLEVLILPRLLNLLLNEFHGHTVSLSDLRILAQLVHYKASPILTASDVTNIKRFELDFNACHNRNGAASDIVSTKLVNILKVSESLEIETLGALQEKLYSLIILPHVKPLNRNEVLKILKRYFIFLLREIQETSSCPSKDESNTNEVSSLSNLFLLLLASLEAAIRLVENNGLTEIMDIDVVLKTLLPLAMQGPFALCALRALNIYLEAVDVHNLSNKAAISSLIYSSLKLNLAAAHHLVREMTCRVFAQLPVLDEIHSVFVLCLKAETIEASITDYREKLQLLKKLSFDVCQSSFIKNVNFKMAPLYFILGSFYVNFQLLWKPLQELVASFASGLSITEFWPVFHSELVQAANHQSSLSNSKDVLSIPSECPLLSSYFASLNEVDDKPDFPHYRLLLWETMQHFPDVCETRNRDIVTLFMSFIESEYYKSDAEVALSWNVKKHDLDVVNNQIKESPLSVDEDEMDCESEDSDVCEEGDDEKLEGTKHSSTKCRAVMKKVKSEKASRSQLVVKTLLAQLRLLAKMRNPRAMHREPDLSKIYHDLLSHKNQNIQKAALECIMAYKHKYLTPYTEHLFALVDSKTYKAEMLSFNINKESDTILKEHRPLVIPIIIKIVYSKMTAKTGMRTGGKGNSALRRSTVLRFLAGCHEEEMLLFIQMAFRFYSHLLKDDPHTMAALIESSMDLENVIPPRRLQSSMNLLSIVQEQFGGLMGNKLLGLILRLLICVGATVKSMLNKRDDVHVNHHNALRLLRNSCLEVLTEFFDRFEAYPWNSSEINTVLDVFVWPVIARLPFEGVYSPTALMKLLSVWSRHPRYIVLFGTHSPTAENVTPLPALMALLTSPKSHHSVCNSVMEILENLLTLKDHEPAHSNSMEVEDTYLEEKAPALPVSHMLSIKEEVICNLNVSVTTNLGSKLLYPHIPTILERLKIRLVSSSKRSLGLTKRELVVLSAISEFVLKPDISATLAQLLIPVLCRRTSINSEDDTSTLKMMATLTHLFRNVEDPLSYIKLIAPLFGYMSGVAARKMLISLVNALAESSNSLSCEASETLKTIASVVSRLNAYDARWVEQPDFDKRLDGFKEVQMFSDAGTLSLELGVIIIYHSVYTIRSEKDLSLKDFSSHCLRYVAPRLCLHFKNDAFICKYLVDSTLLTIIRNSLGKLSPETLQSEAVLLLGEMTRECYDLHPVLKDLYPLANKSDPEVDFFENLQHLQLHRKTRALLKICEVLSGLEKAPNTRTLTQFILPMAGQFLCSDKYSGKNSVVDAAISVIGMVCRLLPWHQYETVLRHYLGRLKFGALHQKQLVRIVSAILNSFHFDLSRGEFVSLIKMRDGHEKKDEDKIEDETLKKCEDDSTVPFETAENEEEQSDLTSLEIDGEDEAVEMEDYELKDPNTADLAIDKQTVLCPSAATRAIRAIVLGLLPQLHRALVARTVLETAHKVNKKQIQNNFHDKDAEEEELLKVPMALAVVKLLQQLPKRMLTQNLPGIFAKLCTFLKSRLESVRRVARETLQKVMVSLGPSYLETMLHEMTSLLTRGFQVHVLVFSIHSVIIALKDSFCVGDIDSSIASIIDVCKNDLFGSLAEEREEGKISSKLREARSSKGYDTLHLVSQFSSENYLTNIILPFKEIIQTSHSHKVVHKASECLRHIVLGLSSNVFVSPTSLLIFAYGVASESIPKLSFKHSKEKKSQVEVGRKAFHQSDCFIIPEAPKHHIGIKCTAAARVNARMNAHLFVDFGLRLIHIVLRHEKFKEADTRPYLDPIIPLLTECLSSQHVKVCTLSLQCLTRLFKFDLPNLQTQMSVISSSIFSLLHKYAAAGLSKGDNFDLVMAAFKAVAVLVRDVKYHTLEQDQLKALLLYAEQDFADLNKHATAFALLKAILSRKLVVSEIHDVMDRVASLSITSELSFVRQQARSVFYQFLMDYPLGGRMGKHLSFYVSQLNFKLQTGRESALEMTNSIVSSFPLSVLSAHCELFFLMVGARLVNDDSPDCRKMAAQCITKMLNRLEKSHRERLYNMNLWWFKDKQLSHKQLAAQLCGLFVEIEKAAFKGHLKELLPIIVGQFSQAEISETHGTGETNSKENMKLVESEKSKDHHLYQVLQLILKICIHCPGWLTDSNLSDNVSDITEHVSSFLSHPHEWVRLASTQILTQILSTINIDDLVKSICVDRTDMSIGPGYFKTDAKSKVKSLILDHCAQLKAGIEVEQQLLFQVVKNLVIFADVLKDVHINEDTETSSNLSLQWLVRRMRKIFNAEVTQAPRSTVMRTMVLNWTAAIVVKLGNKYISPVLHDLLAPVVRERSSDEQPQEGTPQFQLRSLAKEVGLLLKKTVGVENYLQTQSRLQILLSSKRAERRKILKQEAVAEPEKAAKRKALKQARKKEAKKRRISSSRKKSLKKKEVCIDD